MSMVVAIKENGSVLPTEGIDTKIEGIEIVEQEDRSLPRNSSRSLPSSRLLFNFVYLLNTFTEENHIVLYQPPLGLPHGGRDERNKRKAVRDLVVDERRIRHQRCG